ncbi:hypothetical protein BBP83_00715 [Acinetobacter celticus]|uniref:Uncharacterized protein n=1 Tax=Acinetobacter celticus TaxID=1891224 RepID=A0A1C3D018_9GAMM|nr:hypothetical protein BBP83_00715 [Acinetobacter celticus]
MQARLKAIPKSQSGGWHLYFLHVRLNRFGLIIVIYVFAKDSVVFFALSFLLVALLNYPPPKHDETP